MNTTFKIVKEGYDKLAVDYKISVLQASIDQLTRKLDVYAKEIEVTQDSYQKLKAKHTSLVADLAAKERAADEIARLALKEANVVIEQANEHANMIVGEALSTAKTLLKELVRIAQEGKENKAQLLSKLQTLQTIIEGLEFPMIDPFKDIE
jgi:cell division initiation protein